MWLALTVVIEKESSTLVTGGKFFVKGVIMATLDFACSGTYNGCS